MQPLDYGEYDVRLAAYAVVVRGDDVLLSWWNGEGRAEPAWSLPGGGVDFPETLVEGLVREVREETGYDVVVGRPLVTDSWTDPARQPRPFKAQRVVFEATITGGTLGTLEVGGSTDYARWVPLADLGPDGPPRAGIVDVALAAWRRWSAG